MTTNILSTHKPSQNGALLITVDSIEDRLKAMPLPGPERISAFCTSAFILQTYCVGHKEVLLINS